MPAIHHDVVGIGNAIVDVIAHADDAVIDELGLNRGTMTLVDAETAARLYDRMGPAVEVSGGSAANTIAALASLGGRGAFIGKVQRRPARRHLPPRHHARSASASSPSPRKAARRPGAA